MSYRQADRLGLDDGVQLLELSQRAPQLYLTQEPSEKLNFLKVLCSNFTLTDGNVTPIYRQPFDVLALTADKSEENPAREEARISKMKKWYPRPNRGTRGCTKRVLFVIGHEDRNATTDWK